MKLLIVNRNFFVTGGPEKYMFSLMKNMPEHEFIPFCLNFSKNEATPYQEFFLQPPGGTENVYFNQFEMSLFQKIGYGLKMIYSFEARHQIEKLIKTVRPDVALFLNAVYFTDSIIDACRKHKIPVIWRLSDFNKICSNYLLYRDGNVCEDCLEKGLWSILKNRCGGYQKSLSAACIKMAGMYLSKLRKSNDYIDFFITPSQFTKKKMIKGGYDTNKIVHIPTFIDDNETILECEPDKNCILYVGRLSPEKGIETLIEGFKRINNPDARLKIVGDTSGDYAKQLIENVSGNLKKRIQFLGFKPQNEVKRLFHESLFFVVPSVWYENQPNVVLEGMCKGRPALVSDLGSLTEMVIEGKTGYRFEAGNAENLAYKIDMMFNDPKKTIEMGKTAKNYVKEYHNLQNHLDSLNELFHMVTGTGKCEDKLIS